MPLPGQVIKPQVRRGRDPNDCWEWLGSRTAAGYGIKQWHGRTLLARRWLWEQLHGPIAPGRVIASTCGNRGCVNPAHLVETHQAAANRQGEGATLVAGDAADIRAARGLVSARELAEVYGVTPQTIRDVWRGDSWGRPRPHPGPKKRPHQPEHAP